MPSLLEKIAGTVLSAAIIASVAFMWNVNERLARIELRLGIAAVEVAR
jgi:hypothetical protein